MSLFCMPIGPSVSYRFQRWATRLEKRSRAEAASTHLDEDGARVRVLHVLHKRELVLAQHVLVHGARMPERRQTDRPPERDGSVHWRATAEGEQLMSSPIQTRSTRAQPSTAAPSRQARVVCASRQPPPPCSARDTETDTGCHRSGAAAHAVHICPKSPSNYRPTGTASCSEYVSLETDPRALSFWPCYCTWVCLKRGRPRAPCGGCDANPDPGTPYARAPKRLWHQVLDAVDGKAAARERQTLHIAALCAAQRHDAFPGQQVQRQRVDALLVYHHKALAAGAAHLHSAAQPTCELVCAVSAALRRDKPVDWRSIDWATVASACHPQSSPKLGSEGGSSTPASRKDLVPQGCQPLLLSRRQCAAS
jgi:hypothetical protein